MIVILSIYHVLGQYMKTCYLQYYSPNLQEKEDRRTVSINLDINILDQNLKVTPSILNVYCLLLYLYLGYPMLQTDIKKSIFHIIMQRPLGQE